MVCVVILSSFWLAIFYHSLSQFGLKTVFLLFNYDVFSDNKALIFLIEGFIKSSPFSPHNWDEELIDTYQQT